MSTPVASSMITPVPFGRASTPSMSVPILLPWMVSFCAPGVSVIGPWVGNGDDVYARWSGTSFSTAMVSAAAALVLQRSPTFSPKRVKRAIASGAVSVNALNPDYRRRLGRGRLDLLEIFR